MSSIKVENAVIDIPIFDSTTRSLKKTALQFSTGGVLRQDTSNAVVVRALTDINLHLKTGDRLGLIGHNGAGKTTLLRMLAGIYEPTRGTVEIKGRVAALFDVGLGITPDATGYDNIRTSGLYLGMSLSEIEAKIPDVAEFSELGEFLDLPVRTYSQGMLARLAFSVATCVDPEILILDEGIAAGDAAFMRKATSRMMALVERASILVLASHATQLVTQLCTRCAILHHGTIVQMGPSEEVVQAYVARMTGAPAPTLTEQPEPVGAEVSQSDDVRISDPVAM